MNLLDRTLKSAVTVGKAPDVRVDSALPYGIEHVTTSPLTATLSSTSMGTLHEPVTFFIHIEMSNTVVELSWPGNYPLAGPVHPVITAVVNAGYLDASARHHVELRA